MSHLHATPTWVANHRDPDWVAPAPPTGIRDFHRTLDGYAHTPLVELPQIAAELGLGQVFAKDESSRLGLPAFKGLGASWAVHQVSAAHEGMTLNLVTATDGNHGRAMAHFARRQGHRAHVFVPASVSDQAIQAIRDEAAEVEVVDGSYDDAVRIAAEFAAASTPAGQHRVLVQDMAWEGYTQTPQAIVDGYDTLFAEIDEQLSQAGSGGADLVLVPTGVGSLLQAAIAHYRSDALTGADALPVEVHREFEPPAVVAVEPDSAACVATSLVQSHPVTVQTEPTIMNGLNCGTPSQAAWPLIHHGLDAAVNVSDLAAATAVRDLTSLGVAAGPCGAATLAGLRVILNPEDPAADARRGHLHLGTDAVVVLLITEGSEANPLPGMAHSDRPAP